MSKSSSSDPPIPKDQQRKPSLANIAAGKSLSSFTSMMKSVSSATSTAITKVGEGISEVKAKGDQKLKEMKNKSESSLASSSSSEDTQRKGQSFTLRKRSDEDPAYVTLFFLFLLFSGVVTDSSCVLHV